MSKTGKASTLPSKSVARRKKKIEIKIKKKKKFHKTWWGIILKLFQIRKKNFFKKLVGNNFLTFFRFATPIFFFGTPLLDVGFLLFLMLIINLLIFL
jgi:hypothetical protein